MSIRLRILLCIAISIYFILILIFLRKKMLSLKYTLLWILAGICGTVLIVFPGLLDFIVQFTQIRSAMNGLFAIILFFVILLMLSLTAIVSKQSERIKNLIQDEALLEKRVRDLEADRK